MGCTFAWNFVAVMGIWQGFQDLDIDISEPVEIVAPK